MTNIISLKNVYKTYTMSKVRVKALRGIDLDIQAGEFIALVGPSGSGKSTLMHILGCLDLPTSGTYSLFGHNIQKAKESELAAIRNKRIGFVFQNFNLLSNMNAIKNVSLPSKYARMNSKESKQLAIESLKAVGLESRQHHKPNELSGGEQQRIAFARALLNKPQVLLADEPTGNLDSKTSKEILKMICDLNNSGTTIILVTHDLNIASIAKRKIELLDGMIVANH